MNERLFDDIELLAALFAQAEWRELRVSADGIDLLFSRDASASLELKAGAGGPGTAITSPQPRAASTNAGPIADSASAIRPKFDSVVDPTWHAVVAPNLGTFYRSPKPGSPAFVELGQKVEAQTELCLLEVMKLFTSVPAGVTGTIAQICVADAELVLGEQVLFYIQQD